ncbi:uncharacterized protein ZBAI_08107 [Zygosaccharomyces bailii ISA1307]|nr:uncharacterized protein ZBAI_08107 [Zygosaccharomyces bailii ISA1307]
MLKYRKSTNSQKFAEANQQAYITDEHSARALAGKDIDEVHSKEDGEEEEEEEEDDDDDDGEDSDDQKALLQELNQIKHERMVKKIREEQKQHSNVDLTRSTPQSSTSNWRKTTFGRGKISKQKPNDIKAQGYVNDMTKTAYHEDFMRRFVK